LVAAVTRFEYGAELQREFQRAPTAEKIPGLLEAIQCYHDTLGILTEREFPMAWAMIQSNLGGAYAELPRGNREENLRKAIACFDEALRVRTKRKSPSEWARVQTHLGNAYAMLPGGDRRANLEAAIASFEAAMQVYRRRASPLDWAMTQNNLGNVYAELPTGDRGGNLQKAISCYRAALEVHTERDFPALWAQTQLNLGTSYAALPTGDRTANLEVAIACYRAALQVCTEEDSPMNWSQIQHNLGNAYAHLRTGDWAANLEAASACFQAALRVRTAGDFPTEWAQTKVSLGIGYLGLPIGDARENLEAAITCFEEALRVYTRRDSALNWAMTQHNLGNAYQGLFLFMEHQGANIEKAITYYAAALQVYTELEFPVNWSMTQTCLGTAYVNRRVGDRRANRQSAIACYQAALRVRTTEVLPFDRLDTLRSLTELHYREQQWHEALTACDEGVCVLESVRSSSLTAGERTRLLSDHAALFEQAVVCSAELGRFAEALTYAERGKTRNLVDTLTRREVKPRRISEVDWRTYLARLADAQALEKQLASGSLHEPTTAEYFQSLRDDLGRIRVDLERFEAQFRVADTGYLPTAPSLAFADIRAIARQANAILVEFRVTEAGTFVFLLSGDNVDVTEAQVVRVPDFTSDVLDEILVKEENGELVDGWLWRYVRSKALDVPEAQRKEVTRREGAQRQAEWWDCMNRTTKELYDRLLSKVRERLNDLYPPTNGKPRRLILVPNKGLNLLPLHAAHYGTNGQRRYWLDDYEILYAPSCAVLQRCLRREAERGERKVLFAVQNPDPFDEDRKLPFSDWDVEEAAQYFRVKHVLSADKATLKNVSDLIARGHEVLLSCHGTYNLNDVFASHLTLHGDDKLLLSDILQLDLSHTSLIVLSACESAVSDYRDVVDEVQGLHTAFLIAGAPTVVGSQWSVSDLSTALLMKRFHENLYTREMGKAGALREAQIWLRDLPLAEAQRLLREKRMELERVKASERLARIHLATAGQNLTALAAAHDGKPFAHPYWWAAFQCVGAG
jgi:CHAT domain-containing protein/tetratricopeptide (TPR) repeat protein